MRHTEQSPQLNLRDLLDRQIGRFLALKNPVGVNAHETPRVRNTGSVPYQAARYGKLADRVNRGQRVAAAGPVEVIG